MNYLLWMIIGYLSGGVLYAYLLPLWLRKKDITKLSEDQNPGAANAFMQAGIPTGILVLLCELLKGAVPVYIVARLLDVRNILFAGVLCAPVIGHAFPFPYPRRRKGGKAIAVSFGCLIGLLPEWRPLVYLIFFYLLFSLVFRIYPHLYRSIVTFSCFCLTVCLNVKNPAVCLGCLIMGGVVVYKHVKSYQGEKFEMRMKWKKVRGAQKEDFGDV